MQHKYQHKLAWLSQLVIKFLDNEAFPFCTNLSMHATIWKGDSDFLVRISKNILSINNTYLSLGL